MARNIMLMSVFCVFSLQGMSEEKPVNKKRPREEYKQDPYYNKAIDSLGSKIKGYLELYPDDEKSRFLKRYAVWTMHKTYVLKIDPKTCKEDDVFQVAKSLVPKPVSRAFIQWGDQNAQTTIASSQWFDKVKVVKWEIIEHLGIHK